MEKKPVNVGMYFQYVRLARQEFSNLLEKYPELSTLSAKEMEVFELLLTDMTTANIAEQLYITQSAVHFHCRNIYKKLSISSRRQILIRYKELLL